MSLLQTRNLFTVLISHQELQKQELEAPSLQSSQELSVATHNAGTSSAQGTWEHSKTELTQFILQATASKFRVSKYLINPTREPPTPENLD